MENGFCKLSLFYLSYGPYKGVSNIYNLWQNIFAISKISPKVDFWRKRLTHFFEQFSGCVVKIEFPEKGLGANL